MRGRYIAVSYRWPDEKDKITTITPDTEACFAAGFPTSDLQDVFKDAFRIAMSLGVRYVWIDALVIL